MASPEPSFTVVKTDGAFSVRDYPALLAAQVELRPGEGTRNTAFRILADYIFGANTAQEQIGMTAPVRIDEPGENIGMTAPVRIDEGQAGVRMVFYMPARYISATLPVPTDARVQIMEEPARRVGVVQFSGWFTKAKFAEKSAELATWLTKHGDVAAGALEKNYFNAPFTLPWLRRNEVWVPLVR